MLIDIVKIREERVSSSVGADNMQSELWQHQIPLINGGHVSFVIEPLPAWILYRLQH